MSDRPLRLASGSEIRLALLTAAGLSVTATPARVDETAARQALEAEGATPRDVADALAEMKALRVAQRHPADLVLGCDQVLAFQGACWGKPADLADLRRHLITLRGQTHQLISALVLYEDGQPVWRHVGVARLTMRAVSDAYLDAYLARHGADLLQTVGGYKIEGEGLRLFSDIDGDYFTILGLPMMPLLHYLGLRGFIAT